MRLMVLSDLHFGAEDRAALRAVEMQVAAEPPKLVLVAGDVTQSGRRREMEAAADWLRGLGPPIVATPGNHDTPMWNLFSRMIAPFQRFTGRFGAFAAEAFFDDEVAVRSILTARGMQLRKDWSLGEIDLADAAEAAMDLSTAPPAALRIVMGHHPLVAPAATARAIRTRRGAEAARLFSERKVDLVISGHLHDPFIEALPFADNRTYAVGGGTLSHRVREQPAMFKMLSVMAEEKLTIEAWAAATPGPRLHSSREIRLRPRLSGNPAAPRSADDKAG